MAAMLLSMSALSLALLLVWPLLRKTLTASARYGICLVVLLGFLVPFRPTLPVKPVQVPAQARPAAQRVVQMLAADQPFSAQAPAERPADVVQPAPSGAFSWRRALPALWALGALWVLLGTLARYVAFMVRLSRQCRVECDGHTLAALRLAGASVGMHRLPLTLRSPLADGPLVAGLLRPRLVLPDGLEADHWVLRHELIHAKRRDLAVRWAMLIVRAVHWYNPLVWALVRTAQSECEMSCDEAALRGADDAQRRGYASRVLMAAARREGALLTTGWMGGKAQMKRRLEGIVGAGSRHKGYVALVLVLALVLSAGQWVAFGADEVGSDAPVFAAGAAKVHLLAETVEWDEWLKSAYFTEGAPQNLQLVEGECGFFATDPNRFWYLDEGENLFQDGWIVRALAVTAPITSPKGRQFLTEAVIAYATQDKLGAAREKAQIAALVSDLLTDHNGFTGDDMAASIAIAGVLEPEYKLLKVLTGFDMNIYYADEDMDAWFASGPVFEFDDIDASIDYYARYYSKIQHPQILDLNKVANMLADDVLSAQHVQDERALTMANAEEILPEMARQYAGKRACVWFKNGSLAVFTEDQCFASYDLQEFDPSYPPGWIDVMIGLVEQTGADKARVEQGIDRALKAVYARGDVPFYRLEQSLIKALGDEFGIDPALVDECFLIYINMGS